MRELYGTIWSDSDLDDLYWKRSALSEPNMRNFVAELVDRKTEECNIKTIVLELGYGLFADAPTGAAFLALSSEERDAFVDSLLPSRDLLKRVMAHKDIERVDKQERVN
jgi:hypothetical protein